MLEQASSFIISFPSKITCHTVYQPIHNLHLISLLFIVVIDPYYLYKFISFNLLYMKVITQNIFKKLQQQVWYTFFSFAINLVTSASTELNYSGINRWVSVVHKNEHEIDRGRAISFKDVWVIWFRCNRLILMVDRQTDNQLLSLEVSICDLILENQTRCHIWYFEKYQL